MKLIFACGLNRQVMSSAHSRILAPHIHIRPGPESYRRSLMYFQQLQL